MHISVLDVKIDIFSQIMLNIVSVSEILGQDLLSMTQKDLAW